MRRSRWTLLLGFVVGTLALGACGSEDAPAVSGDGGTEPAAPPVVTDGEEPATATPRNTRVAPGDFVEMVFEDGSAARAELVSVYDPSQWWDPLDEKIYGLFFARQFAAWPYDASLAFVSADELSALARVERPDDVASYDAFLDSHGILLDRLPLDGVSQVLNGHEGYHLEENGYGDFAWDLVKTDQYGARFVGDGRENADYRVWGEPVYAPVSGTVVEVVRDGQDNRPGLSPDPDVAVNNMVGIAVKGAYSVYLLHFQEGSIPDNVVEGAFIEAGSYLGLVGNSGVTYEPHLHMTLLWYDQHDDPPRSWSVPVEMADVYVAPALGVEPALNTRALPATGSYISNAPF